MTHPQEFLVPWVVFLGAITLKLWQFGMALKRHLMGRTPSIFQFRHTLERIWIKDQQVG